jgi:hypothetical protein
VDQSRDSKVEVKSSILLLVELFLLIYSSKKMLVNVNIIIFILFTSMYEFLNI